MASKKNEAFKPQMKKDSRKKAPIQSEAPINEAMMGRRKVSREGFAWCLYLLGSNLLRMVWLSILVSLCCCTVILAPAAVTGATRSMLVLLRGRGGLFWEDFREDFGERFLKKLGMWLMLLLIPVAIGLWMYILGADAGTVQWVILVGLLLSAVLQAYFFVMAASLKLPLETCLKNALLLLFLEWKTTIVFLIAFGLVAFGAYMLFPFSIPVLCFFGLSCMMLLVTQQVRRILLRRGLYLPQDHKNETENCDDAVEGA